MKNLLLGTLAGFVTLLAFFCGRNCFADEPFQWKEIDKETVALYEDNSPVWNYVYQKKVHDWVPKKDLRRVACGYFHPLFGFGGESLTINATINDNHAHHHGLWCSFMTVLVHDEQGKTRSFDTWTDDGALKRQFVRWIRKEATDRCFTFEVENGWFVDGKEKIMEERIAVVTHATEIHPQLGKLRAIDFAFSFHAVGHAVTLAGDRKYQKNFSSMAIRFEVPKAKPVVLTSDGALKGDSLKIPLSWLDYQYKFGEKGATKGVAVFPGKDNPVHKSGWAVRHYGMIVTGWPGCEGVTLSPGDQPVTLRYRILLHEKTLTVDQLQKLCDEYQR